MENIGDRIKTIRKFYNLTQAELAQRLCVTQSLISALERGLSKPSRPLMKLICLELEVNISWLARGEEPMFYEDDTLPFKNFCEAVSPIVQWMKQNGSPHEKVVIEMGSVWISVDEMRFTFEELDKAYIDVMVADSRRKGEQ